MIGRGVPIASDADWDRITDFMRTHSDTIVPCPYCRAAEGDACTRLGAPEQGARIPHPSRRRAAKEARA